MDTGPAVDVSRLSKRYGTTQAVADVSLVVRPGEAVGLVGPNGSGKTTFLRGACGLLKMDSGSSRIAGHDVLEDRAPAMASLSCIPELPAPFPGLTPREHLLFTARVYGLAQGWEARAAEVLKALDLELQADRLCDELSKGQKQKVHVAEAMLRDPPVLLLDEPLIGIDPKGVRVLKDWIRARVAAGGSALVSSHALSFVEEVCTRFAILEKGRLLAMGSLEELRSQARTPGAGSLEDAFLRLTDRLPDHVLP